MFSLSFILFLFFKDLYQIIQCWLLDYRLNSSFLPHLSVTRNDIEPVTCPFKFYLIQSTCLESRRMFVCPKRFDFSADCRVVRLVRRVFVNGHECIFLYCLIDHLHLVPPNPEVILVDLVTCGFVSIDSTSCLFWFTGNDSVRGEGLTRLRQKYCFHVNSGIIGFSPKCF